jgi:asparagine synthetase B (glutamine-hydrolysing)
MCGIGGHFAYGGPPLSEDAAPLERMSLRMRPRGPDGSGIFVSGDRRIGLVHRKRCSDHIFHAMAREGMMRGHEHPSI